VKPRRNDCCQYTKTPSGNKIIDAADAGTCKHVVDANKGVQGGPN